MLATAGVLCRRALVLVPVAWVLVVRVKEAFQDLAHRLQEKLTHLTEEEWIKTGAVQFRLQWVQKEVNRPAPPSQARSSKKPPMSSMALEVLSAALAALQLALLATDQEAALVKYRRTGKSRARHSDRRIRLLSHRCHQNNSRQVLTTTHTNPRIP